MATDEEVEAPTDEAGETVHEEVSTLHGVPVVDGDGIQVLHPAADGLLDLVATLKDDGWLMCLDVTVVDHLANRSRPDLPAGIEPTRFEVVIHLMSHAERARLRIRVQAAGDPPTVPSLVGLHAGAEAMEREAYDMFGVHFEGHPDLTRILMPEDWDGYPLRKDYSVGAVPVQFKEAERATPETAYRAGRSSDEAVR